LATLTASHCKQRAERYRMKMIVAAHQERRLRLLHICHGYRRLADRAVQKEHAHKAKAVA
jgi:hypothetical protein